MSWRRTRRSVWISPRIRASSARPSSMIFSLRSSASRICSSASLPALPFFSSPNPSLVSRLSPSPLARATDAALSLLKYGHLLLQLRVRLQHPLVAPGLLVDKRVDLMNVEAAKPAHAERLLANIERANAHETSDGLADLGR